MLPENYTLPIFEGQGVKHALGYGLISRVPFMREKAKQVTVKFESGQELLVAVENLQPARMPESELEYLRAKHGISAEVESEDADA
ncbi:Uncharacterised protein [uncultured archaeon]|nr:Uncharacterised protein [uncultured archaeon]